MGKIKSLKWGTENYREERITRRQEWMEKHRQENMRSCHRNGLKEQISWQENSKPMKSENIIIAEQANKRLILKSRKAAVATGLLEKQWLRNQKKKTVMR